ncbi:MAG: glycoside hydrolase family 15 protein [Nakamurella sp.]
MSWVPIEEHAFLSDCTSAALVTSDGSVDWLCLPRFDSPALLARLLDDEAGHLQLRPVADDAVAVRRYLPHTLVLETTWTCRTGTVIVRDALALGARERGHELGNASPGVLLRHVRCQSGSVPMRVEWAPRPEFGLVHPKLHLEHGAVRGYGGSTVATLSTETEMTITGSTATATVPLRSGDKFGIAVEQHSAWEPPAKTWSTRKIGHRLDDTERAWRSWSELHQHYAGPLRELVHHSGVVLQGLTFARTGAIIAAATTSLPEGRGSSRTWDYRFTWVRDASMTMRGLRIAACPDEARRFFSFLARAAATQLQRGLNLQIMFGPGGEHDLTEREVPHLSGWCDSSPVRTGNAAWSQHQQDVYGAMLDAAFVLRDQLDPLEEETQTFLVAAVEAAALHWADEDQGIWEIRGPARRYLHSALMCWVALDRGIRLADLIGAEHRAAAWIGVRDQIRDAILTHGWNSDVQAFTQVLDGSTLDASSLLMATVGILPSDDPRLASTIDAVIADLSDEHGLLYRYRDDDGLQGEEGTFLLCSFWLIEALAITGRSRDAEQRLHRAAACANDLGLLAEQVSRTDGHLLGNYPQAFSHLGLILAAHAVATATAADPGQTGGHPSRSPPEPHAPPDQLQAGPPICTESAAVPRREPDAR